MTTTSKKAPFFLCVAGMYARSKKKQCIRSAEGILNVPEDILNHYMMQYLDAKDLASLRTSIVFSCCCLFLLATLYSWLHRRRFQILGFDRYA